MKVASFIFALVLLLLPAWGCGDDQVCENFDVPTAQTCDGDADCDAVNCEAACATDLSNPRGGAFCGDTVCECPCRVCVGYN